MRYTVGPFQVDTDAQAPLGDQLPGEYVGVPMNFLLAVGQRLEKDDANRLELEALLEDAQQPRPIEQALAVLAQAWQSAVKPAESERVAMPDVPLEAQRAGWDAHVAGGPDTGNPWPTFTPLWQSWREGWLAAQNEEDRP